jgi:hypothetical protein
MSVVRSLLSELIERRLWPVAVGLLAALIAVPVLLSKPATEGSPPSQATPGSALLGSSSAKLLGETQPAVSVRSEGAFRKHVNRLARKNPFVQQATGAKPSSDAAVKLPDSTTTTGTTPTTNGTTTPTTNGTTTPTTKIYRYEAKVKFGRIGSTKEKSVDPGEFLPSKNNPVLLYVAASNSGDEALFVVTSGATARGDADCSPSDSDCQLLTMKKDNVEFIEVSVSQDTVVTYELELVDIVLKEVKNPPSIQSKPLEFNPSSRRLQRMSKAMRTKRVFSALDQLGF